MIGFLIIPLIAALSTADIEQIIKFDNVRIQRTAEAKAEARRSFAGRGNEVVDHFLKRGDYPPSGGAYIFVLSALGDVEATIRLIRALPDPPSYETGPTAKYGMGRDFGEVRWAIDDILESNAMLGKDTRVIAALVGAVEAAKAQPKGIGIGNAGAAVSLLARCSGPTAVAALQKFAADSEPSIRALAVEALGRAGIEVAKDAGDATSTFQTLTRALRSDTDSQARVQAAAALARLKPPHAAQLLVEALQAEKDSVVVDAIAVAMAELKVSLVDAATARATVERCWDPSACAFLFEQWRASADRAAIQEAAVDGAPVLRALALRALTSPSVRPRKWASLMPEPLPPPVQFDPATGDRLLTSVVDVLGREVTAFPRGGRQISYLTAQMLRDALWEITGRNMVLALSYADRIVPISYRYTGSGRYGAALDLQRRNASAYDQYRRPRQVRAALRLALPIAILMFFRPFRRSAALLIIGILAWGVWSVHTGGVRELPPPPLHFFTVSFIAFAAAAVIAALLAVAPQFITWWPRLSGRGQTAATIFGAVVLAFIACAWTRSREIFPIGGEGWELFFDPLGSAVLAGAGAFVLSALDVYVLARLFGREAA